MIYIDLSIAVQKAKSNDVEQQELLWQNKTQELKRDPVFTGANNVDCAKVEGIETDSAIRGKVNCHRKTKSG